MDPTQGSSEAGPSRLPYTSIDNDTQAKPTPPPPPPSLPVVDPVPHDPSDLQRAQQQQQPRGGSRGPPQIVPTVLAADGIREVPWLFELCEVEDLITLISSMLDRLMAHNDRIPLTPTSLTRFHSRAPPSINVRDYLLRIARYTNVEPCCLLILLPYVDKVCARMNTFTISSLTVHRFIIAGVSVGSKALSDSFCTNGRYARVGGVSVPEMNLLEKEFCEAIDWRLTTTGTVLAHYYTSLVTAHPAYRLSTPPPAPAPQAIADPSPEVSNGPAPPRGPLKTPHTAKKIPLPHVSATNAGDDVDAVMAGANGRGSDDRRPPSSDGDEMMNEEGSDEDAEDDDARDRSQSISASSSSGQLNGLASDSHASTSISGSASNSQRSSLSLSASPASQQRSPHPRSPFPLTHLSPRLQPRAPERTSSPALIPEPPLPTKRLATASNLPSPVVSTAEIGTSPLAGISFPNVDEVVNGSGNASAGAGGRRTRLRTRMADDGTGDSMQYDE